MKIRIKETVMNGKTLPFAREQKKPVKTKKKRLKIFRKFPVGRGRVTVKLPTADVDLVTDQSGNTQTITVVVKDSREQNKEN